MSGPTHIPPIAEQSAYPSRLVCMCGRPRATRVPSCPEHMRAETAYAPGGIAVALWPELDDLRRAVVAYEARCAFAGEDLPLTDLYARFGRPAVHVLRLRIYTAERSDMERWPDTPERTKRLDALDAHYFDVLFLEAE